MSYRWSSGLLAASVWSGSGAAVALAQDPRAFYDPAQLPALRGKVVQYDLTPRGDVDGLILAGGMEVHFPPRLGTEVVAIVRPGQEVTVHGLKAHALPLVQAMSITAASGGATVADSGPAVPPGPPPLLPPPPLPPPSLPPPSLPPPPPPPPGQALDAQGTIKMQLHGAGGELNGVLLADGTIVHLPPPEAARLADQLRPAAMIAVRGEGVSNALGRSIDAQAIGPSMDRLARILVPPPGGPGLPPGAGAPPPSVAGMPPPAPPGAPPSPPEPAGR